MEETLTFQGIFWWYMDICRKSKSQQTVGIADFLGRRRRDLNSRDVAVYTISSRAPSARLGDSSQCGTRYSGAVMAPSPIRYYRKRLALSSKRAAIRAESVQAYMRRSPVNKSGCIKVHTRPVAWRHLAGCELHGPDQTIRYPAFSSDGAILPGINTSAS